MDAARGGKIELDSDADGDDFAAAVLLDDDLGSNSTLPTLLFDNSRAHASNCDRSRVDNAW